MTAQTNLSWYRSPTESAKSYTATLTAGGAAIDLTGASIALVCSLWSGGEISLTSAVQAPASGGIVTVQPSAAQLTASTAGIADAYYRITFADATIRCVPDNGGTFQITLR